MNSWQKQRRNIDFLLKCMMIKRGSGLSKEDISRISDMIDKEENHLINNYKSRFRGSFHKQILYNLPEDKRVINYIENIEETDCRASLYLQLGVIETLRDFFELGLDSVQLKNMNNNSQQNKNTKMCAPKSLVNEPRVVGFSSSKSGVTGSVDTLTGNVQKANDPKDRGAKE